MIKPINGNAPKFGADCFIAETAVLIGEVTLGDRANVWYGAVLRADIAPIEIGENSNIQDNCVVHVGRNRGTYIGNTVSLGHGSIVHACRIGDHTLVGMGAIIMDDAEIEGNCIIGAAAFVPKGMKIPAGVLVLGSPAKIIRKLSEKEIQSIDALAGRYLEYAQMYL